MAASYHSWPRRTGRFRNMAVTELAVLSLWSAAIFVTTGNAQSNPDASGTPKAAGAVAPATTLTWPPAYKMLRYDEDWSPLREPALASDWLDPVKYIPFNHRGDWYLTLGGEARERYEYFHNYQWGQGPQDGDGYFLQRYLFHTDVHLGEVFRGFVQLQSSLENGRNGGPRPTDKDELDLHQAFFDLKTSFGDKDSITLRIGRQELAYGSSRLVSVRESPNVRQSFDGVKVILKTGDWQIDAFATRPVETKPGVWDDGSQTDKAFWGAYAVTPLPWMRGANVDLYYLGLERENARFDQGTAREVRHSVGTRLWGERDHLDWNFEFVYQFGTFGKGDISAWTAASDTGYTFAQAPLTPRLNLKADITSGDRNPKDPNLETFNPLFPRGAYFGEPALIGPANHMDVHPGLELKPAKQVTLTLDWDFFWRESTNDGLYDNGVNLIRSGQTTGARYVGNQAQTLLEWQISRHFALDLCYAHFFAGPFLKESGPGKDVDYASAWLTSKF
jgi:hypothetical protein